MNPGWLGAGFIKRCSWSLHKEVTSAVVQANPDAKMYLYQVECVVLYFKPAQNVPTI